MSEVTEQPAEKASGMMIGAGVAACAVCCAPLIVGALSAIGIGTAAGYVLFGAGALLVGAVVALFVVLRRRRRVSWQPTLGATLRGTQWPTQPG